jgi:hypothetical protein
LDERLGPEEKRQNFSYSKRHGEDLHSARIIETHEFVGRGESLTAYALRAAN